MSEDKVNTVRINISDAADAFRDLNEFVMAIDRIGSRIAHGRDSTLLHEYVVRRDVGPRMARLRRLIADALESVVGEEEMERIGEESYIYTDD